MRDRGCDISRKHLVDAVITLFSYIMDGFAYAGEALAGRFIGPKTMWGYVNAFAYCSYGESASLVFHDPLCVGREEFSGIIDERYLSH